MSAIELIKSQAESLTDEERAELAHFFLSTLDDLDSRPQTQWDVDLARRVAEIRAGTAKGRDVDEVLAELEERFP
jgi:hypothetical protein